MKNKSASILQKTLFVVLTSSKMIALVQFLSILHLSICMPSWYLAGKSHEFKQYGWGVADMGRVLDMIICRRCIMNPLWSLTNHSWWIFSSNTEKSCHHFTNIGRLSSRRNRWRSFPERMAARLFTMAIKQPIFTSKGSRFSNNRYIAWAGINRCIYNH